MSEYCLYCHEEISPEISWSTFFTKEVPTYLCSECDSQLIQIQGETCQICSRPLENLDPQFVVGDTCYDCVRWEEDPEWKGTLQKNDSIYVYNDFLKELMGKYKFRGDYILAKAFSEKIKVRLQSNEYDFLAPIPLSEERQYSRGFNQSEAFLREAGFEAENLLQRTHSEKQSKKSRNERIHLHQVFQLVDGVNVQGKRILLIDDIYTTGSTLRHAAKILKNAGAVSVESFTLARG